MANLFVPKDRRVVPNFRRFSDTVALGELNASNLAPVQPPDIDFESRISDWNADRSLGLAGDLVGAALVSGRANLPAVEEAAAFILEHSDTSSPALISVANRLLKPSGPPPAGHPLPRLSNFVEDHSRLRVHRRIHQLKEAAAKFGDDAILYTELARLYLIVGNVEKAQHSIRVALALAPMNRYVLRSAARLFAHCNDPERAFDLLHRNARTPHDPWLTSAELAVGGLIGASNAVMKRASRMTHAEAFSPFSLSELRAGVGSVELLAGDRRAGKRLLRASLEKPNDNALAQVEWALSRDRQLFEVDLLSFGVNNQYEALALEAFNRRQWKNVVEHCESWLMDTPFASRPVMMASHVATVVLDDFGAAQLFCQAGRLSSPRDPALLNNYAYALALDNKSEAALEVLDGIDLSAVQDASTRVCLTATRGLAYFRSGRISDGRSQYAEAIEEARNIDNASFRQLALLHYVREEVLAGQTLDESTISRVRDMRIDPTAVTTQILKEKVVSLLDSASAATR